MADRLVADNQTRRAEARKVRQWSVDAFHHTLKEAGIYRAYIVYENGQFRLSHPKVLAPIQAFFELSQDFANHEGIFLGREEGLDSLFCAYVHDTRRGLAQGGLRFAPYQNMAELLVDGLRLSQGMTRKNALAGLTWGGGKGIMTLPSQYKHPSEFQQGPDRRAYFEAYGRFVASLGGIYYTAEDVGTNTPDMSAILTHNRFTTCIPTSHGGSGNPSPFTARGVLRAMQAAWFSISGSDNLHGVKVAVQGTGNVGAPLIRYLDDVGAEVYVSDVNKESIAALVEERPRLKVVEPPDAIFDVDADIFAPCAIGAQVNVNTIPRLKVKLVCGAANNILKEPEADAERLRKRQIGFVPDFICNRMGIINCADEWQGYLADDIRLAAERVYPDTLRVFKYARSRYSTTTEAANDLADMAASELHPMLGHRGRRLIDHLVQSDWKNHQPEQPALPKMSQVDPAFVPRLDEPMIRNRWEREGEFLPNCDHTLAATPMTTASSTDLASVLSSVLLDVKARALQNFKNQSPKRVIGSEHGGLALQLAVEQNLPYEREEVGRSEFLTLCRDYYHTHDFNIRDQLQLLGVGYDHNAWITPMHGPGRRAVEAAYDFLDRADLTYTLEAIAHHCPRCQTIRVASEVNREHQKVDCSYRIALKELNTSVDVLFPEYLLGAVALAVHPESEHVHLAGQTFTEPLQGRVLPIVLSALVHDGVELISPLALKRHEKIAQETGLMSKIQIFDKSGQVCSPGYEGLSREEARKTILERFAGWEEIPGEWTVESFDCGRCEARVIPRYGEQTFVKIQPAVKELKRLIEVGEVTFSSDHWKNKVLHILKDLNLWCVSRQYWWGNRIKDKPEEVLSTWFSLAIWSLHGAGWPENPRPKPIEEVFVDGELLFRWIIPSQLASLIIMGQPVFQHIEVHGTLHVIERALKERPEAEQKQADEERFLFHSVRRPMRYRLGNMVEPISLVQRFGADALRLGYMLSLDTRSPEMVTLSEERLSLARRSLTRLVSKLTGLFHLIREPESENQMFLLDEWVYDHFSAQRKPVVKDYLQNNFSRVARQMVADIEDLIRYINVAVERKDTGDFGQARRVVYYALQALKNDYAPLTPFLFAKLDIWFKERGMPVDKPLLSQELKTLKALLKDANAPVTEKIRAEKTELYAYFKQEVFE